AVARDEARPDCDVAGAGLHECEQARELARRMLAVRVDASAEGVVVVERPPVPRGDADAQALVAAERVDDRAVIACDVSRPVRRAVVHHEKVGLRDLLVQRVQHGGEVVLLVPGRDEDEGVAHTRSSSSRAPRICRAATVSAASSQTSAPGVGATRATWTRTATPWRSKTWRKLRRARKWWRGVQTTIAFVTPRSRRSGSVRDAFPAVVDAVPSTTSSPAGARHSARICAASDGPP